MEIERTFLNGNLDNSARNVYFDCRKRWWVMARRMDLIDQFTELVVGADDPRRLAERTLEVVMSLLNGRSSAVFTCNGNDVTLFASRGIDQAVLEIVPAAWASQKESLRRGELLYIPDRSAERRVPTVTAD